MSRVSAEDVAAARPAVESIARRTPVLSSRVASRIAANMIDAPKKITSVQRAVFRSTGRKIPRG